MALELNSGHSSLPPPCTFLFELVISSAVVGFTRPGSLARPAALPFVATCVYVIVSTANMHMRPSWAVLLGGYSFSFLLRYIDLALLSQWSFEHHGSSLEESHASPQKDLGPVTSSAKTPHASQDEGTTTSKQWASQNDTFWERLCFGWSSMWAYRHLNSKYEIKNIPPFSTEDPAYNPPRWLFVFRRTLLAAVDYLLADLLSAARPPPKNNAALFDDALVPVFRRLGSITGPGLDSRPVPANPLLCKTCHRLPLPGHFIPEAIWHRLMDESRSQLQLSSCRCTYLAENALKGHKSDILSLH